MIDERKIIDEMTHVNDEFLDKLSLLLRQYDYDTLNVLSHFVASLCDVEVNDMLSSIDKVHFSQARWLFWYAYRYVTRESFVKISERTVFEGHSFAWRSVAQGIENMSRMIEEDGIWKKRWAITKMFINAKKKSDDAMTRRLDSREPIKVILTAPKGTHIELKES